MPYTLSMALLWVALAVLLGIVIGWLMRSVVARRQVERARSHHVDTVEIERLRGRVAALEPAAAERDRLRIELESCRASAGISGEDAAPAEPEPEPVESVPPTAEPAPVEPSPRGAQPDVATFLAGLTAADVAVELDRAASVIGAKVTLDDLTVVEGIGPKIADLCHGIGIRGWADLAETETSLLRTMLADAGPRFRTHDPESWPQQAALLAAGRWEEFQELTGRLDRGRDAEPS